MIERPLTMLQLSALKIVAERPFKMSYAPRMATENLMGYAVVPSRSTFTAMKHQGYLVSEKGYYYITDKGLLMVGKGHA